MSTRLKAGLMTGAVVLAAVAGLWMGPPRVEDRVYVIGFESDPPFQSMQADGSPTGAQVEAVKEAARRQGIRLEWRYSPESSDRALKTKSVDLWPIMTVLEERKSYVHFTTPVTETAYYLFSMRGKPLRLGRAAGRRVGTEPIPLTMKLAGKYSIGAQIVAAADPRLLFRQLCGGELDGVFADRFLANVGVQYAVKECEGKRLYAERVSTDKGRYAIASTHEASEVADLLREEYSRMAEDGELASIGVRFPMLGLAGANAAVDLVDAERSREALMLAVVGMVVLILALVVVVWRLRTASQTAQEAVKAKREFLANMSHEIRTPLTGVIGMLDLAMTSELTAEQSEDLKTARESAKSLERLLGDILDFSRIEARRLELSETDFSVEELVAETVGIVGPLAERKGLKVDSAVENGEGRYLRGDAYRLRQVILNLLTNALKFTERGTIRVGVRVREDAEGGVGELAVEVADTGIGIERGQLERIFGTFEQADGSMQRRFGGTGLGLAISKHLVELMGGRIWVESEAGRGSKFSFSVRLKTGTKPAQVESDARAKAPSRLRVLVAEDNAVNQKLLKRSLERDGHEVTIAPDGDEAVKLAMNGRRFDVILMDVQMPGLDGLAATSAIRSAGGVMGTIPIIALTAHALKGDRERFLEAGMDDYLPKPVDLKALRALLEGISGVVEPVGGEKAVERHL